MYDTRQPITTDNFNAFRAGAIAAMAATEVQAATAQRPYITSIAVDVEARMASFFRENPGCTEDDLYDAGFTPAHVTRYRRSAATRAAKASVRQVA